MQNNIIFQKNKLETIDDLKELSSKIFFCSFLINTYNGLDRNSLFVKNLKNTRDDDKTIKKEIFIANHEIEQNGLIIADEMRKECIEEITYCISSDNEKIIQQLPLFQNLSQEKKSLLNYTLNQQRIIVHKLCDIDNIFITIFVSTLTKSDSCVLIETDYLSENEKLILRLIFLKSIFEIHKYDFLKKSVSTAIGSIMSRNGSHNIGSHVLAALSHNVGTLPDDRELYKYIQHRMDYIAQVCTEFTTWTSPMMFVGDLMKTFFAQRHLLEYIARSEGLHAYHFQDCNMDLKTRREQSATIKLFVRRITAEHYPTSKDNRVLIAKTVRNGQSTYAEHLLPINKQDHITGENKYSFIDYESDKEIQFEKDIALAIPGGVVGRHAFYTILENIIRNAAKHGWSNYVKNKSSFCIDEKDQTVTTIVSNSTNNNPWDNLELYIDFVKDDNKENVEFTIWDNVSDIFASWKDEYGIWKHDLIVDVVKLSVENHLNVWNTILMEDELGVGITEQKAKEEKEKVKDYLPNLIRREVCYLHEYLQNNSQNNIKITKNNLKEIVSNSIKCLRKAQGIVKEYTTEQNYILDEIINVCNDCLNIICNNNPEQLNASLNELIREDYIHPLASFSIEFFRNFLASKVIDSEETQNLVLPLHWQQQLRLATPLIDKQTGALNRENWGLAEMKISVGYLQKKNVEEIGGLDDSFNYLTKAIISPVACPGICHNPHNKNACIACTDTSGIVFNGCGDFENGGCDCPRKKCLYHLGYRFNIPKPKEFLIILSNNDFQNVSKDEKFLIECRKKNIYFAQRKDQEFYIIQINGIPRREPIKDFNFEYVVFDTIENTLFEEIRDGKAMRFPFRLMTQNYDLCDMIDCAYSKKIKRMIPQCNINLKEQNCENLKCQVYNSWLDHLRKNADEIKKDSEGKDVKVKPQIPIKVSAFVPLRIHLFTQDESASGNGLISKNEVWKFFFEHRFRSLIGEFLDKNYKVSINGQNVNVYDWLPTFLAMYFSNTDFLPNIDSLVSIFEGPS